MLISYITASYCCMSAVWYGTNIVYHSSSSPLCATAAVDIYAHGAASSHHHRHRCQQQRCYSCCCYLCKSRCRRLNHHPPCLRIPSCNTTGRAVLDKRIMFIARSTCVIISSTGCVCTVCVCSTCMLIIDIEGGRRRCCCCCYYRGCANIIITCVRTCGIGRSCCCCRCVDTARLEQTSCSCSSMRNLPCHRISLFHYPPPYLFSSSSSLQHSSYCIVS